MDARRNFSEVVFRSGSQPLKFFRFDDVKLEYYRTPCHRCKIPPPGFAFFSTFFLLHRGFVRWVASGAVCSFEMIGLLFSFSFLWSPGRFSRFLQVRTRVLIHIDKNNFGGSALENSDGVNLPVWVWWPYCVCGLSFVLLSWRVYRRGPCVFS